MARLTHQKWSDNIDLSKEHSYKHIYKRLWEIENMIENIEVIEYLEEELDKLKAENQQLKEKCIASQTTLEQYTEIIAEINDENQQYKQKLANGEIIKLPCKVGDTVYVILLSEGKPYCGIQQGKVQMIGVSRNNIHIVTREHKSFGKRFILGKTVFSSLDEAEKALKEMRLNNG